VASSIARAMASVWPWPGRAGQPLPRDYGTVVWVDAGVVQRHAGMRQGQRKLVVAVSGLCGNCVGRSSKICKGSARLEDGFAPG